MDNKNPPSPPPPPRMSRLAQSAYLSPYSHAGAPSPHPNTDPYAPLRSRALATLEAMGFEPETMVERGVVWAEDQDPYGHMMHSQFMHFLGTNFHRTMEMYDQWLSEEEYDDLIKGKTVAPVVSKYELKIRRQVKYPDSLIAAHFEDRIEPTKNHGTVVLFSLQQQTIVAQVSGCVTFMDMKKGRAVDIRTLGGGYPALFEGMQKKAEHAHALREKWLAEHPESKI